MTANLKVKMMMSPRFSFVAVVLTMTSRTMALQPGGVQRRSALEGVVASSAAAVLLPLSQPAFAAERNTVRVAFNPDPSGNMSSSASFEVPADWQASDTRAVSSGGRRLVVYADPTNSDTNVFLLITPIRGDYTSLGSFGSLDSVQDTIIPRGPDVESDMLKAFTSPGRYNYEYTIVVPDQPKRHLNTVFTVVADNIVTFTTQATEADFPKAQANLATIASSFALAK